jgi:hypothetical protein
MKAKIGGDDETMNSMTNTTGDYTPIGAPYHPIET